MSKPGQKQRQTQSRSPSNGASISIQALGVNPFPEETSRADSGKGQSQRRNDIAIVLHHTAGNTVLTGQTQSYNSET